MAMAVSTVLIAYALYLMSISVLSDLMVLTSDGVK